MMLTPVTILIMNTDRQVIKYQIPSTHVLGEEFNYITLKYRCCPVSIIFTFSSLKAKLVMGLQRLLWAELNPFTYDTHPSHYIILNFNTHFIIRRELDIKFLIVLFPSNNISKFRNMTVVFTCKMG